MYFGHDPALGFLSFNASRTPENGLVYSRISTRPIVSSFTHFCSFSASVLEISAKLLKKRRKTPDNTFLARSTEIGILLKLMAPKTDDTLPVKSFWAIASFCLCSSTAAAQEDSDLRYYGAINQALLKYDDGVNDLSYGRVDNAVGDNVNRFGVELNRTLSSGWDMTGTFELGLAPKASNQVDQLDPNNSEWEFDSNTLRKLEVAFAKSGIGTFHIGQGDMSGRGSAPDFSGTSVIASSNPAELAGGNYWRLFPSGDLTDRELNEVFDNYDSGRRFRVRYDSPERYGITVSASAGRDVLNSGDDSTYLDAVARYEKHWKKYGLAVEFNAKGLGQNEYAAGAGFAAIHKPSGLNISASASHTSYGTHYGVSKIGIKRKIVSFGETALSYDMYNGGSFVKYGTESISDGYSLVQSIDSIQMDIYLSVRTYEAYTNIGLANEQFLTSKATAFGFNWTF